MKKVVLSLCFIALLIIAVSSMASASPVTTNLNNNEVVDVKVSIPAITIFVVKEEAGGTADVSVAISTSDLEPVLEDYADNGLIDNNYYKYFSNPALHYSYLVISGSTVNLHLDAKCDDFASSGNASLEAELLQLSHHDDSDYVTMNNSDSTLTNLSQRSHADTINGRVDLKQLVTNIMNIQGSQTIGTDYIGVLTLTLAQ